MKRGTGPVLDHDRSGQAAARARRRGCAPSCRSRCPAPAARSGGSACPDMRLGRLRQWAAPITRRSTMRGSEHSPRSCLPPVNFLLSNVRVATGVACGNVVANEGNHDVDPVEANHCCIGTRERPVRPARPARDQRVSRPHNRSRPRRQRSRRRSRRSSAGHPRDRSKIRLWSTSAASCSSIRRFPLREKPRARAAITPSLAGACSTRAAATIPESSPRASRSR